MKNLWDMTLSEVISLIGCSMPLELVINEITEAQKSIAATNARELIRKIDKAKADLAKPPKPEPLFLSEKDFLNASKE